MILNPLQWSYQGWQWFFIISGCWNLIGAIGGIFNPALYLEKHYSVKTDDFMTVFLNRLFWIVVFIFGIGYILIAFDPILFYGIIIMGIIGKITIAILWLYLCKIKKGERIVFFYATADILFALIFTLCLFSNVMTV